MPNTISAIRKTKRIKKQSIVNKLRRNRYRTAIKKLNKLIDKKDSQGIKKFFPTFQSELMKVAKTGVVKKENASRKIARLSKKLKKSNSSCNQFKVVPFFKIYKSNKIFLINYM